MLQTNACISMTPTTIVIIGGGCSGTLAAIQIMRRVNHPALDVILVERAPAAARGLAYDAPSDRCKLNVPARGMSAFPDEQDSFLEWVRGHDPSVTGDEFISRRVYGSYLQDLLRLHATNQNGASLRVISDEVIDLLFRVDTNKWDVVLKDRPALSADYCVLALGNLRRVSFCGVEVASTFYDPYKRETYESLSRADSLLILGSGLTAVDSVIEAEGSGFRGSYTMLSRHGRIPLPHEPPGDSQSSRQLPSPESLAGLSLRSLTKLVVSLAREQGSSQGLIVALRPYLQEIWRRFSDVDKKRFLRHVRPIWEIHRHRIPKSHYDLLEALKRDGRLTVLAGHLKQIQRDSNGAHVKIETRDAFLERSFGGAILCAGPEGDLNRVGDQLVKNILKRGVIKMGPLGLGGEIVEDAPGSSRLFMIGPLQRESLWEITAVREIREEAVKLADSLAINTGE